MIWAPPPPFASAAPGHDPARTLRLTVSPAAVPQGETLTVRAWAPGSSPPGPRLVAAGQVVPLHPHDGGFRAFVGTSPLTRPGPLLLRLEAGPAGARRTVTTRAQVRAGQFGIRRLTLPPDRARLLDPVLVARERRRIAAATRAPHPVPLWSGAFRRPVDGPVTSGYGVRSVYNGVVRGYHFGVDFRGATGTPVRAAQHGIIRLAEMLPLSGNTVVIDHGAGLFTTYQHLSAFAVRPRDRVVTGRIVGAVGSTGLATGPHLHWGMRLHGIRVNPLPWTR